MLDILINHFIEIILGFIITFLTYMYKKLINYNRMIKFVRDGVKALLKTKIIEKYNYHKELGTITIFDIVTDYNKLIHKFPSNLVALICRYSHKNYFDGKDMTDDDTEDFKV